MVSPNNGIFLLGVANKWEALDTKNGREANTVLIPGGL